VTASSSITYTEKKEEEPIRFLLRKCTKKTFKFGDFFFFKTTTYAEKRAIASPGNP